MSTDRVRIISDCQDILYRDYFHFKSSLKLHVLTKNHNCSELELVINSLVDDLKHEIYGSSDNERMNILKHFKVFLFTKIIKQEDQKFLNGVILKYDTNQLKEYIIL